MTCIYKKSNYYLKAYSDPSKIAEPIGYKFLNQETTTKQIVTKKKQGQLVNKFIVEKSLIRQISSRGTPHKDVEKYLKICEMGRKNNYFSGTNIDYITKNLPPSLIIDLKERFFFKSQKEEFLYFLELLASMSIINDNIFSIRDYALSTYFVYYDGQNTKFYNYLDKTLKQEFLEYEQQILINSKTLSRPQLRKVSNYSNKAEVEQYINLINEIGKEKDNHFSGVHIYVCDKLPKTQEQLPLMHEQNQLWMYLQFNIVVMLSILGQGQHAILKIKGNFSHKTNQFIFLLKLAFGRVYLHKDIISNPFTNDKYIVCDYFNKENGKMVAQYLLNNYDLLTNYGDEKYLVDHKLIFIQQDFQLNLMNFNDLSPIIKISNKDLLRQFSQNSNINFYPNKEAIMKKVSQLKVKNLQEILDELDEIIPNAEKKEEKKKQQVIEKKAEVFNQNELGIFESAFQTQLVKKKHQIHDISHNVHKNHESVIDSYISQGDKLMQEKKDKSKKKKAQKREDL